jgi:hypothetical protein
MIKLKNTVMYNKLDLNKFSPNYGTQRGVYGKISDNSSTIFLSKEAFRNVEKLYMHVLIDTKLKKTKLYENEEINLQQINKILIKNSLKVNVYTDEGMLYFYNNDDKSSDIYTKLQKEKFDSDKSLFKLFFNVKAKYAQSLLELLVDILRPMDIYGKINYISFEEEDEEKDKETKDSAYLRTPKLVLYFYYPNISHQEALANIHNYIMIILENISDEMIHEIACDCYLHDENKEIACGQSFTLPINKLMFFNQGGFSESGRAGIVTKKGITLNEKTRLLQEQFDGENFYKYKEMDELEILYYQKKYYKYKLKYKLLKNTKI